MSKNLAMNEIKSDLPWKQEKETLHKFYKENGYVIVDNFLPQEIAEELYKAWKENKKWEKIDQVRETHYQHVFKTESKFLPNEDESYIAKFDRSNDLEDSERINQLYDQYFKPALSEVSQVELSEFDMRCYRLQSGDFYRTHIDDYAGAVGMIYYINKDWIWDWGGLLHVCNGKTDDQTTAILPVFNRAMIIDHANFRFPHFISAVSEYAKNPRYTIVSFNK